MWTSLKNFPDDRNSQCLFDSLTYLAILWEWVFLNTWYSWPSQEETPPCQYRHCCVQKAFWNKYTNISVLNSNVLCGVERAFWNTHTYTRTQTYQFWLCNTPLTCQCPSQVQAAAPKIWDDGWQLYIIILSTYLKHFVDHIVRLW